MFFNSESAPAVLQGLFTAFTTIFQNAFEGTPVFWDKVAMSVPSSTSQNVYPWLGRFTQFREWVGARVVQGVSGYEWTVKNKTFEDTIGLDREMIEDDTYGVFNPVVTQLGVDAKKHPDVLIAALMKNGFAIPCFDGQDFFDADHPVNVQGNLTMYSNVQTGSGPTWYLLDTTKAIKPWLFQRRKDYSFISLTKDTDPNVFMQREFLYGVDCRVNASPALWQFALASQSDLSAANYQAARAAMGSIKQENGQSLSVTPNLLVVPPALEGAAKQLLHAEMIDATSNIWKGTADVLVVPELA
jgi:phage major head subunit gpT-like protein